MVFRTALLLTGLFFFVNIQAQSLNETSGWLFFLNSTKLNNKVSLHFDGQLRSNNNVKHSKNLLIRPGITYHINSRQNATLGYAFIESYAQSPATTVSVQEHRIWQQYIITSKKKVWNGAIANRFRLEQRFIGNPVNNDHLFSQRLRYFARTVQPLKKPATAFVKGPFISLQNEIMFNIQNKKHLNGHLLDQNRLMAGVGMRFNPKLDLEIAYMNQAVKRAENTAINNIIQLGVYTKF